MRKISYNALAQFRLVALSLFLIATSMTGLAQEVVSSDKQFRMVIPPMWSATTPSKGVEWSYDFPGPEPLQMYMMAEEKNQREVLNEIRKAEDDVETSIFKSGTGLQGTKIRVKKPLSTPGTFIYQLYYLFSHKKKTYGIIFVSGICRDKSSPEAMFDAIASSAGLARKPR